MSWIWIALDDADDSNGAVQYVPGSQSHLRPHTLPISDVNGAKYLVLALETFPRDAALAWASDVLAVRDEISGLAGVEGLEPPERTPVRWVLAASVQRSSWFSVIRSMNVWP